MNATGDAEPGTDTEATLIVENHNFAIYFNGYCLLCRIKLISAHAANMIRPSLCGPCRNGSI